MVKTFRKCNSPAFKFDLNKLIKNNFNILCNVNFDSVFTAIYKTKNKKQKKTQRKFNIKLYGKNFISSLSGIKCKIWMNTFLKKNIWHEKKKDDHF